MIVYPAIDLRNGKVVRLKEGDPAKQTVFSDDPVATVRQWAECGVEWIHMVNLDGALAIANDNLQVLEQAATVGAKIQFGGGLRTKEDIAAAFEMGASRVVLGTVAVTRPQIVPVVIQMWGTDAICIALDARNDKVMTHGWQQPTSATPAELGKAMSSVGVKHVLYTDVSRDGLLDGVNVDSTVTLARETGLQVIASGGVNSLDNVQKLVDSNCVAGVIIGTALYERKIDLSDALAIVRRNHAG